MSVQDQPINIVQAAIIQAELAGKGLRMESTPNGLVITEGAPIVDPRGTLAQEAFIVPGVGSDGKAALLAIDGTRGISDNPANANVPGMLIDVPNGDLSSRQMMPVDAPSGMPRGVYVDDLYPSAGADRGYINVDPAIMQQPFQISDASRIGYAMDSNAPGMIDVNAPGVLNVNAPAWPTADSAGMIGANQRAANDLAAVQNALTQNFAPGNDAAAALQSPTDMFPTGPSDHPIVRHDGGDYGEITPEQKAQIRYEADAVMNAVQDGNFDALQMLTSQLPQEESSVSTIAHAINMSSLDGPAGTSGALPAVVVLTGGDAKRAQGAPIGSSEAMSLIGDKFDPSADEDSGDRHAAKNT